MKTKLEYIAWLESESSDEDLEGGVGLIVFKKYVF